MAKRVADLLVDVWLEAGVQRVYGVTGDSLNGIADAIHSREQIRWIHSTRRFVRFRPFSDAENLSAKLSPIERSKVVCAGKSSPLIGHERWRPIRKATLHSPSAWD